MESSTSAALTNPGVLKAHIERAMVDPSADSGLQDVLSALQEEEQREPTNPKELPPKPVTAELPSDKSKAGLPYSAGKAVLDAGANPQIPEELKSDPTQTAEHSCSIQGSPTAEMAPPESNASVTPSVSGKEIEYDTEFSAFRSYVDSRFNDMVRMIGKLERRVEVAETGYVRRIKELSLEGDSPGHRRQSSSRVETQTTLRPLATQVPVAPVGVCEPATLETLASRIILDLSAIYPDPPAEYLLKMAIRGKAAEARFDIVLPGPGLRIASWSDERLVTWIKQNAKPI